MDSDFQVEINSVPIRWDLKKGILSFFGINSALFWTDPSLINMLTPIVDELGKDLFRLIVAYSSSLGTKEDYNAMISTLADNFEQGFLAWGRAVSSAGWGCFELPEYNPEQKQAVVIVRNSWELNAQRNLPPEKQWGTPFMQGKIIGIFSHAFGTPCWANDICYYDSVSPYTEIKIFPTNVTIEDELKKLRHERMLEKEGKLADEVDRRTRQLQLANKEIKQYSIALKESETKYRNIFESSIDGIFQSSFNGELLTFNPAFAKIIGYDSPEEMISSIRNLRTQFYCDASDRDEFLERIRSDGMVNDFQFKAYRKDKQIVHLSLNALAVRDEHENVSYIEGSIRDISEKKEMEELKIAKEAVDKASQLKSEFLANMSHEIRTPMNAIIGMTHLAMRTELTPQQLDYLSKIKSSAHSLLGIINDILDFSKIEAGKIEIEHIDFTLDSVLDSLSNVITLKAEEKGLELVFFVAPNVPRFLVGDPLRLGQVLINLGNNAIKFTESGVITIAVNAEEIVGDNAQVLLRFSVKDTGIGLTDNQMEHLFKSFSQADSSTTRVYGGTGLGLAISKRLVEMMSGDISVTSRPGLGSEFSFTAKFGRQNDCRAWNKTGAELRGRHVLVVDDNPTARKVLDAMLQEFDLRTVCAASGEEAIHQLSQAQKKNDPFDLVLMDWQMPGMDGIEAIRHIRYSDAFTRIPIMIMVTAYGREELLSRTQENDLDGFLLKPINPCVLFDTLTDAIAHKEGSEIVSPEKINILHSETIESFSHVEPSPCSLKGRVLLAEDNAINQQVAQEMLEGLGLSVSIACNGREAVEMAGLESYDLVLMDIQMPEMDGYRATGEIRKIEGSGELPIIAMTAHAMRGDREKCLEAGMNDHLAKPIDFDALRKTLARWLAKDDEERVALSPTVLSGELQLTRHDGGRADGDKGLLPEVLPGIDMALGLSRVRNNQRLYRKLLLELHRDHGHDAASIGNALSKGDREEARRLAHALKGVAGNLGAVHLCGAAGDLDSALKGAALTGGEEGFHEVFIHFCSAFDAVMSALGQIEEHDAEGHDQTGRDGDVASDGLRPIDAALLRPLLTQLKALLDDGSPRASDLLPEIHNILGRFSNHLYALLSRQVEEFAFEDALHTLAELEQAIAP